MNIEKLKPLTQSKWDRLTDDEALLYALILVQQKARGFDIDSGICHNVLHVSKQYRLREHLSDYTVNVFPVKSTCKRLDNASAFFMLPLWKGSYGENRKAYLKILIVRVAKRVNKTNSR